MKYLLNTILNDIKDNNAFNGTIPTIKDNTLVYDCKEAYKPLEVLESIQDYIRNKYNYESILFEDNNTKIGLQFGFLIFDDNDEEIIEIKTYYNYASKQIFINSINDSDFDRNN